MIHFDIDVDELLSCCDRYDRIEIIEALMEDGYLPRDLVKDGMTYTLPSERFNHRDDFNRALGNLRNRGWQLSKEEEDYIKNISNRFL